MKKARPNSVVVLPSHHGHAQFKDKPVLGDGTLGSGGMSGGNSGGLAGRMTLRRMILTAGGLLFAYITVTTILGSGPGRERRGPVVTRPEADPYLDVPHDNNAGVNNGHRNSNSNKPPPVIKIDPIEEEKKDPWAEPVKQPGQDIHVDDSKPQQQQEKPPPPPPQKQLQEQPVVQEPDNSNKNNAGSDAGESEDEGESNVDEPVETESMLTIATKARQNSPVSYPDLLSAIRRERDYAIALIVREADMALKSDKVYSVTLKNQTAPSGDVHDYLSLSKYYWPNKKFASGLPYVHIMGMAYHFTGDSSYAEKCAMRLKEWFLDEATYMNPNINYGSLRKGEKLGARTGVLDMFTIFR
ncbi:hypothetical protein BGW38_008126 [Lunasporangiospora selenospora]|uniref:Alginate lyase domain-containing protein n=1 Tax=Lunasporangiospora selenospora TaxID=979761 RepID=A0A9P6FLK4_9FUNG|nr:hypothetical protein BGW38_008126 [Lunasporangiospora selenospora]